jgi:Aspartyl protease
MRNCAPSRREIQAEGPRASPRAAQAGLLICLSLAQACLLGPALAAPTDATATATTPAEQIPAATGTVPASLIPGNTSAAGGPGSGSAEQRPLSQVIVQAPEPRYVAPTRRDRIGRIWAPVLINGRGPFRLVLDSGATTSGITAGVARALGLAPDNAHRVLLRGVVGAQVVPIVRVQSFSVGDIEFGRTRLPIVTDALGGADGILGTDGMAGHRILINFHHDLITISRSHGQRAPEGYVTIPFDLVRHELLVTDAWVGGVRAKAIIDTGGQVTIANLAMRNALESARRQRKDQPEKIEDVTESVQPGNSAEAPPILLGTGFKDGTIKISNDRLTYGDMHIFEHWHMTHEPAMLIGMDTLGRLDVLIIDYRLHELQLHLDDD